MDELSTDQVTLSSKQWLHLRKPRRAALALAAAAVVGGVVIGIVQTTGGQQRRAGATVLSTVLTGSSSTSSSGSTSGLAQAIAEVPSQTTETSTLTTAGVRVTVSGHLLPVRVIALAVRGSEESAITRDVTATDGAAVSTNSGNAESKSSASLGGDVSVPSDTISTAVKSAQAIGRMVVSQAAITALPHAVAVSVLRDMLWQTAEQQGAVVPWSTAQAHAQQEMDQYEATGATRPSLPSGETVQQAFISTGAIHTYQEVLTIDKEETLISRPSNTVSSSSETSRTPALAAWMRQALAASTVTVSNVDGVSVGQLATDLPTTL